MTAEVLYPARYLPRKGREIPLRAFSKETSSELDSFFSTISVMLSAKQRCFVENVYTSQQGSRTLVERLQSERYSHCTTAHH